MHRFASTFLEFSEMLQRRYPEDEWLQKEFERLWQMAREYEPLLHAYEHVKSRSGYAHVKSSSDYVHVTSRHGAVDLPPPEQPQLVAKRRRKRWTKK